MYLYVSEFVIYKYINVFIKSAIVVNVIAGVAIGKMTRSPNRRPCEPCQRRHRRTYIYQTVELQHATKAFGIEREAVNNLEPKRLCYCLSVIGSTQKRSDSHFVVVNFLKFMGIVVVIFYCFSCLITRLFCALIFL